MKRMKTFFIYFLIFIGFMIFSFAMEMLYLYTMYVPINENGSVLSSQEIELEVSKIKATNVNGIISLKAKNKTSDVVNNKYIRIDLIDRKDLLAATKYIKLENVQAEQSVNYNVTFKASEIEKYRVSVVNEAPDIDSNVIEIFGIKIDINNAVITAIDTSKRMPDIVYAVIGIFVTIRTGNFLWMLYCLL